jgi:hypothetical protein
MTRTVTPAVAHPTTTTRVPHERIAMRAYEKWLRRGCPHGTDQQDWLEAEAELTAEMNRGNTVSGTRPVAAVHPTTQTAQHVARRR